jgi:hypothetical protein
MITNLRAHGLNSVMFTQGTLAKAGALAPVSDRLSFPVYTSWMYQELGTQWLDASPTLDIAAARSIIGPMVDALKVHPSIKGYHILDDATTAYNEKLRLAAQVFRERDPSHPASPMMVQGSQGRQVYDYVQPDAFLTCEPPWV